MHSQIRNKTFQIPVPQTKKNYKNRMQQTDVF